MKMFKLHTVPAIVAILLLAVVLSCQTNNNKHIMSDNGTITEFYPDGKIKSIRKDYTYIFYMDEYGNVGLNIPVKQEDKLLKITIENNVDYKIDHPCPANKLSITTPLNNR